MIIYYEGCTKNVEMRVATVLRSHRPSARVDNHLCS